MRLEDDYEENEYELPSENGKMMTNMAICVAAAVILIVGIVVAMNYDTRSARKAQQTNNKIEKTDSNLNEEAQAIHESVQKLVENDGLTSDQLDFWETYKDSENGENSGDQNNDTVSSNASGSKDKKDAETKYSEDKSDKDEVTDAETNHVNQTMIKKSDGTEEWVTISPYITKNKYNFEGLVYETPIMKYYENSKNISYMGVDISKENGTVDFNKLKKAGVQFVMIKVGARGYGSGQITLDDHFTEFMEGATKAGLNIGVYFFSQAITKEEALEEANLVYESIKNYKITYPIAFYMEKITGDISRVDSLTKEEKSSIALEFLQALKNVGYKGIIYGNKEWLIQKINLSTVGSFDVWLSQVGDVPDYPYKFSMWQYTQSGKIDGINGDASLDICFINYEMK